MLLGSAEDALRKKEKFLLWNGKKFIFEYLHENTIKEF